jgi:hypothetical protein
MIRKTLIAAGLAGLTLLAQAAPVVVNFTTDGLDGGSLIGQTVTGELSYDDATLTSTTASLALLSFSFTLAGQTYTIGGTELDNAAAAFVNGLLVGVDATAAGAGAHDFAFSSDFGSGAPYLFYTNSDDQITDDFGFASMSFQQTAAVPEPASYALVLAALGACLYTRRRRAA